MRISDWSSDVCSSDLPRHRQREQIAALAGGEGVDLVDDDRPHLREHRETVGIAQQQRQRFRRGQQDLRRPRALARLAVARRVAGARLDADVEPHFLDRRSEEHTSELQSLMRISYAVFCLKKKKKYKQNNT